MKNISILTLVTISTASLLYMGPAFAKENHKKEFKLVKTEHFQTNQGLHLGQIKHGREIETHHRASTSTLAFQAAVKQAETTYLAAIRSARTAFLAAVQQARINAFGSNSTTPTTVTNLPPTIATAATATPLSVIGNTSALSVLGADDNGEAALNYSWSVTGPGTVSLSLNNSNQAKNTVATFTKAGVYVFQVNITDAGSLSVASTVVVTVNQTLSNVTISPATTTINVANSQQFTATSTDQFGQPVTSGFTWSTQEGIGSLTAAGLYAPSATGTFHVVATSNVDTTKKATSTINVISQ